MNNKVADPRRISREQGYEIVCAGVNQVKAMKELLVLYPGYIIRNQLKVGL